MKSEQGKTIRFVAVGHNLEVVDANAMDIAKKAFQPSIKSRSDREKRLGHVQTIPNIELEQLGHYGVEDANIIGTIMNVSM